MTGVITGVNTDDSSVMVECRKEVVDARNK